jgi:segregation and condensation protein A
MIRLKLPNFEGPLDLLLYLIRKNELDIKSISLAKITREYLEYLTMLRELDLNIAGEYLVMAATLIKIKVRSMLPHYGTPEYEEVQNEAELLVQKLREYEKFKNLALLLREKERKAIRCWKRGSPAERKVNICGLQIVTYRDINVLLADMLTRTRLERPVYALSVTKFDIKKRMDAVLKKIVEKGMVHFMDLIEKREVEEIIATFIAILELVRMQKVNLVQKQSFGRIILYDATAEMAYS